MSADLLVVTHAATFIDALKGSYAELRTRDAVLFDEADLLADAADLRSTFSIEADVLKRCSANESDHLEAARLIKARARDEEDRVAASAIIHAIENPVWYREVGRQEDGSLTLKHRMPGRILRRLVEESPRCIFTSGTLQVGGRFDYFTQTIGLRAIAPESRHIDPAHHGSVRIEIASEKQTYEQMAARIMAAERPALVLTTSHATTQALGELCEGSTWRAKGESLADALDRVPDDGILITANAWSGLDDPRLRWKTIVIPKAPYGKPCLLDGQHVTRYVDSKVVAMRRTNQGLHRGLREPDAKCKLLLLDPRSNLKALHEAIPARFQSCMQDLGHTSSEPSASLRLHMSRERPSNALRLAAFKHHGAQCSAAGCAQTILAAILVTLLIAKVAGRGLTNSSCFAKIVMTMFISAWNRRDLMRSIRPMRVKNQELRVHQIKPPWI